MARNPDVQLVGPSIPEKAKSAPSAQTLGKLTWLGMILGGFFIRGSCAFRRVGAGYDIPYNLPLAALPLYGGVLSKGKWNVAE